MTLRWACPHPHQVAEYIKPSVEGHAVSERTTRNWFQKFGSRDLDFVQLDARWQKVLDADGDYFED